jgi:hypothetical protein
MAASARRSVIAVLLMAIAIAGAIAYRAGYISPVTLFAENSVPVYPQPVIADSIHVVNAVFIDDVQPRRVTSTEGTNIPIGWAHDRSLLFVSDRIGRAALYVQPIESDSARLLTDYAGMTGHARTTPDAAAVLFTVAPSLLSRSQRIMRLPLGGGDITEVVSGTFLDGGARCAAAPAMLCAIAERHDDGKHVIFSALNPVSGRGRELARVDGDHFRELRWDLSPDGTRIAVADAKGSRVRILLIGGPAAENISVSGAYGLGQVSFTSDSRGVIVPSVGENGASLMAISLRGHAQLLWDQPDATEVAGIASPDGQHVAVWVRHSAIP